MSTAVVIEEQGLRDGFQNEAKCAPTDFKLAVIDALIEAGLRRIQVCSFVHPKYVPQMADADQLARALKRSSRDGEEVIYSGLVLNLRGVTRALDTGLDHLAISLSASDTHSQKNTRKTLKEARAGFKEMVDLAKSQHVQVRGGIQCAFGCRYEGEIDQQVVLDLAKEHLDRGVDELALADSTGMAHPRQMFELLPTLLELAEGKPVILHLHDTEGKAMANVLAALQSGVRHFDTGIAGMGGCPYIESASGNLATEDLVHFVEQLGYSTGIDLNALLKPIEHVESFFGRTFSGKMGKLLSQPALHVLSAPPSDQ